MDLGDAQVAVGGRRQVPEIARGVGVPPGVELQLGASRQQVGAADIGPGEQRERRPELAPLGQRIGQQQRAPLDFGGVGRPAQFLGDLGNGGPAVGAGEQQSALEARAGGVGVPAGHGQRLLAPAQRLDRLVDSAESLERLHVEIADLVAFGGLGDQRRQPALDLRVAAGGEADQAEQDASAGCVGLRGDGRLAHHLGAVEVARQVELVAEPAANLGRVPLLLGRVREQRRRLGVPSLATEQIGELQPLLRGSSDSARADGGAGSPSHRPRPRRPGRGRAAPRSSAGRAATAPPRRAAPSPARADRRRDRAGRATPAPRDPRAPARGRARRRRSLSVPPPGRGRLATSRFGPGRAGLRGPPERAARAVPISAAAPSWRPMRNSSSARSRRR